MEQVREFAVRNPVAWMATAEDNQPHVRGVWMWFADKSGFYFHTGTQKRFAAQLMKNPRVEFAFYRQGEQQGEARMVRVTGKAEIIEDTALEKRLFEERTWLNDIKSAYPNDRIFIYRIPHGEAQYWDMSRNCREKEIPPIVF